MSGHTNALLPLTCAGLVLAFRLFFLVRFLWKYPLNHGPRFFFGVEAPPGFYEGPGILWLRRYRSLLLLQHLILIAAFVVPVALRRWNDLPIMAPVDVITFFALIGGFALWVRRKLGANPPRLSRVAVPLEARRLRDYISWPMEAMIVAFLAFSWVMCFTQGEAHLHWQQPVLITYAVLGMLPLKIIIARGSFPLPPERTEEHDRWLEAQRRCSLQTIESMRWSLAAILAWHAARAGVPWLRWSFFSIAGTLFLVMTGILIRYYGALASTSRDLRPVGSWVGPFQRARVALHGGLTWGILYCSGFAALLVLFRS
jgi:hypothetical protein